MKRVTFQFAHPVPRAFVVTALLGAFAFAGSAFAATSSTQGSSGLIKVSTAASKGRASEPENAEARISRLHDILQITPSQEGKWKDVAEVMRQNADRLDTLAKARMENGSKMTAVDDLKSYDEIAEAHEKGIDKLLPVFTALYDDLSNSQKKAADAEFRNNHHHDHHRMP